MITPFDSLQLPCGITLKNRIVKAAMEENLANAQHNPDSQLCNLYHAWAKGGAGMLLTGNVMVDARACTGPAGVVLDQRSDLELFRRWAESGQQNDCKMVMQINHPGRQVFKAMGGDVLSPSDTALDLGKHSDLFTRPSPMTEAQILETIAKFVQAAELAQHSGFDGVQIHAAHGYLISQFLSPLTNKRTDTWGGSLQNRARILLQIVEQVRKVCGDKFILAVKLNSADFQRGGFDVEDAIEVVKLLNPMNLDFLELSGGSYEAPAMQGATADARSLQREAYFLEFAKDILVHATMPIMTTGGITRLQIASDVVNAGVDLVGLGRALAFDPELPNKLQTNAQAMARVPCVVWKDKTLSGLANMALARRQLIRMGAGKPTLPNANPLISLLLDRWRVSRNTKAYRKWLDGR